MNGDLTTLANAKAWLDIDNSNSDAQLARVISAVSKLISNWTQRQFFSQSYTENRDGTGTKVFMFANYPVTAVASVFVDDLEIPVADDSLDAGYRFDEKKLWLQGAYCFARGRGNIRVTYTAGYTAEGDTITKSYEYHTVPATSPYTVTVDLAASYDSNGSVNLVSSGATLTEVASNPATGQYSVDEDTGIYTFNVAQAGLGVLVTYDYTNPVPGDIEQACLDLIGISWRMKSRIGLSSQGMAGETTSYIVKALPDYVQSALQPYKKVILV